MLAQRVVRGAWGSTDSGPAAENGEGDEAAFQLKTAALQPKLATSHGKRKVDVARPNEPKCLRRKKSMPSGNVLVAMHASCPP